MFICYLCTSLMERKKERVLPSYLSSALTSSRGQAGDAVGTALGASLALLLNVPSTTSASGLIMATKVLPGIIYLELTLKKKTI